MCERMYVYVCIFVCMYAYFYEKERERERERDREREREINDKQLVRCLHCATQSDLPAMSVREDMTLVVNITSSNTIFL